MTNPDIWWIRHLVDSSPRDPVGTMPSSRAPHEVFGLILLTLMVLERQSSHGRIQFLNSLFIRDFESNWQDCHNSFSLPAQINNDVRKRY
jgi:hypothetical protein